MVKLFLVEDEIIMRKGMKNIDWASKNIELVGDASDGELAYPMILETKPDILLTDIKMPFMDGLELSERVKKELPEIQIIILSGFGEFSYAQKAVSLGVTEYLLKPVTPDKLLETVVKVKDKIEETRKTDADREYADGIPEEKRELRRQRFFRHLVMNTRSSAELLDMSKELDINLTARYFSVILLSLGIKGVSGTDYSQTRNEIVSHLERLLTEQNGWSLFDRGENGLALLVARNHEDTAERSINQNISYFCEMARQWPDLDYFIGVGPMVNRVSEIKSSYEQATKAVSHRFLSEPNQVLYAGDLPVMNTEGNGLSLDMSNAVATPDVRDVLEKFMHTGSVEEIKPLFDELFQMISEQNLKSKVFLTYIFMDMYLTMMRFAKEVELDSKDIDASIGDMQKMLHNEVEFSIARDYLIRCMELLLKKRDSMKEGRFNSGLREAVTYIDEHFSSEDISLAAAASIANLSPNHFSAIFSKQMGMTFMEYLSSKRMKKAKELLLTTDLLSSEIAFKVGYKDPHYFSHTFNKNLGMSPKEYRMSGGKGEA